ncbi:MAG: DNA-directed RNA polymerase subunit RPC12/RpoP [Pirellulaceae bacterium]|jgi:DNA-directed RNA polymerase subunit RPC12/RpoP
MNVTYRCPQCDGSVRVYFESDVEAIDCPECGRTLPVTSKHIQDGEIRHCVVCHDDDLFVRKNFSQKLGVSIIAFGFIASSIAYFYYMIYWSFGILLASALVDLLLYTFVGNMLECYRCHTEYRNVAGLEKHEVFSLETHERFRQQAARLADQQGTPSGSES